MENKRSNKVCFGCGFRKVDPSFSAVGFNPAVREKEIAVEIDPVSKFCIETIGEGEDKYYRYRSDISMLLHAKENIPKPKRPLWQVYGFPSEEEYKNAYKNH